MKKTYQSPVTMIGGLTSTYHLMGASIQVSGNSATVNSGEYESLSRRGSFWEDNE